MDAYPDGGDEGTPVPIQSYSLRCRDCNWHVADIECDHCGRGICNACWEDHPCQSRVDPPDARELEIEDEVSRMGGGAACS